MQALVKTPRIKIDIQGEIPDDIISVLKKKFPNKLRIINDPDDILVDVTETDWYKETEKRMTPGKYLRIYRENAGLTQTELGKKLGKLSRHYISALESGTRGISKDVAKKLAKILKAPLERFM